MNIVYAMTRNLYPYFKATLTSLLEHNKPKRIYILAEDDKLPYKLPDICKVINVSDQEVFRPGTANYKSVFTYMAMMRVCYTDLLPRVNKVLQLDIDTIICDDLTPLWKTDLTDKWFAACPEYFGKHNPWNKPKYYNVGVCLFNLQQMRKDKITPKLIDMLNSQKLWCIEQDALNYYGVPDKVVDLPARYNESFCCGKSHDPAVVHYAGHLDWYCNHDMDRHELLEKYLNA